MPAAKFPVPAIGNSCTRWKRGTKFRLSRQSGLRFYRGLGQQRNFERDHFVRLKGKVRNGKRSVVLCGNSELVVAGRHGEKTEDAFARSHNLECLPGLEIAESELRAG